jgi:hypothetical protein
VKIPYSLNKRLTDDDVVVLTIRPRSTPQKHFLALISVIGRVNPRAIVRLEGLGKLKIKFNELIGKRNHQLPTCSIVPQHSTLLHLLYVHLCVMGIVPACSSKPCDRSGSASCSGYDLVRVPDASFVVHFCSRIDFFHPLNFDY